MFNDVVHGKNLPENRRIPCELTPRGDVGNARTAPRSGRTFALAPQTRTGAATLGGQFRPPANSPA
jgi:hypothetical protein